MFLKSWDMKLNYKRLGEYIREVNIRNSDLKVSKLLGLSMTKEFRETTSNTIGTDMSIYKIVRKWQFACDFMSPIRVNKLPVVLKTDEEPILVSPAYPVFEVVNRNNLDPEYLMMWFRRSEFDRYVTFKCDSAVRGGYDWEELYNTLIPVPTIEKQKEIVAEYKTITNRIEINNRLIQKLEETAQAIYKQWFVDFEFPDEEGKPYKSNGGEMMESEMGEVPKGWRVKSFTDIVKLSGGGTPSTEVSEYWNGVIPFFTPADISDCYYTVNTEKHLSNKGLDNCSSKLYKKNTTFVTARGTVGSIALAGSEMAMNQTNYAIIGKYEYYTHQLAIDVVKKLKNEATGAVFSALVTRDFELQNIIAPDEYVALQYNKQVERLYNLILNKELQNNNLDKLKELLLAKMVKDYKLK
jgi:type I restriction enzyme S subunit